VDSITLPPLRERKEDIPLLVDYFIKKYSKEMSSKVHCISPESLSILLKYSWPGNIRELKNCIHRAITYCDHDAILTEHLPSYLLKYEGGGDKNSLTESIEKLVQESHISELPDNLFKSIEKRLIPEILKKTGWNQKRTAAILGLSINTLKGRLKECKIKKDEV
jgi:DNA-binding NtrC family response regulator